MHTAHKCTALPHYTVIRAIVSYIQHTNTCERVHRTIYTSTLHVHKQNIYICLCRYIFPYKTHLYLHINSIKHIGVKSLVHKHLYTQKRERELLAVINASWEMGRLPTRWKSAVIHPIPKPKGPPTSIPTTTLTPRAVRRSSYAM